MHHLLVTTSKNIVFLINIVAMWKNIVTLGISFVTVNRIEDLIIKFNQFFRTGRSSDKEIDPK